MNEEKSEEIDVRTQETPSTPPAETEGEGKPDSTAPTTDTPEKTPEGDGESGGADETGGADDVETDDADDVETDGADDAETDDTDDAETDDADDAETDDADDAETDDADDAETSAPALNIPNVSRELKRLVELATKHPEIGPPLAELAFKLDYRGIGERILSMGLEDDERGLEFYFTAADIARREDRYDDMLERIAEAVKGFVEDPDDDGEEKNRLLHLVRLGFNAVLYDLDDMKEAADFTSTLSMELPKLREHYQNDSFFHSLLAQARWFDDKEISESIWDQAAEMDDPESAWNSRGTWYKEAENDLARAESAYRKGLQAVADSSLLRLNLAQALMDRADKDETDAQQAMHWVKESEGLLRNALRQAPRNLRRHIHENLDRAGEMKKEIPSEELKAPEEGDEVLGRVVSMKKYGAFIALGGGHTGLLHNSEIAHEWVDEPGQYLKDGGQVKVKVLDVSERKDGDGLRISLSRKALLPPPEKDGESGGGKGKKKRGGGKKSGGGKKKSGGGKKNKSKKDRSDESWTLGDMLKAKLAEEDDD